MKDQRRQFEWVIMRHLEAAYNVARWYLRNEHDAEDIVQDSMLKAYQAFPKFRGVDGKPWLLKIVRNGCIRHLERQGRFKTDVLEEEGMSMESVGVQDDPEAQFLRALSNERVRLAIESLPSVYREVIVLREFEELSYAQISEIVGIPCGTVMSRLSRARVQLASALRAEQCEETP